MTEGVLSDAVKDYVDGHHSLARAEGEVYAIEHHGDILQITEVAVSDCPFCGGMTTIQQGRTACCGDISNPHKYGDT